jgi:type I restriction enzyme M protein
MVLDKENAADRDHIFMIKASQGFVQEGHKNRLRARDIHQMTDAFNRQLKIPDYSRSVSLTEIEKLGYNLNLARYFDDTTPSPLQHPVVPMTGGKIPTAYVDRLEAYWRAFPNMRYSLFADTSSTVGGDCQLIVEPSQIQTTVLEHPDFAAFTDKVTQLFASWTATAIPLLTSIKQGQRSIGLIDTLSESLLDTFRTPPDVADLLNPYRFYQHLMDYWENTMQRDVCVIIYEGWQAMRGGTPNIELIEPSLIIERYFEQDQADHQDSTQKPLTTYADLTEQDTVVMKKIKNGTSTIHLKVIGKYSELTQDEVKTLVVNNKWLATLERCVHHELHHCGLTLSAQIQQIAGYPMASIRLD